MAILKLVNANGEYVTLRDPIVEEYEKDFGGFKIAATIVGEGGLDGIEKPASGVIYMLPIKDDDDNIKNYEEYIYVAETQTFELLGSANIDLTSYITTSQLEIEQNRIKNIEETYLDETKLKAIGLSRDEGLNSIVLNNMNAKAQGSVSTAGGVNTVAQSRDTFAQGFGNIAGGKGFRIIAQGPTEKNGEGYYELNTIDGIESGQEYIVRLSSVSETFGGKIIKIEGNKVFVNYYRSDFTLDDIEAVDENGIKIYNPEADGDFTRAATDCNYLCIIGRPDLGDISIGFNAVAFGENNIASERSSAVFGRDNKAVGQYAFATGRLNTVNFASFASGLWNEVSGVTSHAEGNHNIASGNSSHAEGFYTEANAPYAHAEGEGTKDKHLVASGRGSHAEGYKTEANNLYAHAEGRETTASGDSSHAEGQGTQATNTAAHAEGEGTKASGQGAHAEGYNTQATNYYAHAEGRGDANSGATGDSSHSEGQYTLASKPGAHAEGIRTQAVNNAAHAEGKNTVAFGLYSHAEGDIDGWSIIQVNGKDMEADAHGHYSHREGRNTTAYNNGAHAEGEGSIAYGYQSHAEGKDTQAIGSQSHAEGKNTQAKANCSHTSGLGTMAKEEAQTVVGKYNDDDSTAKLIVGVGTSSSARSNAFTAGNDGTSDYITVGEEKLTEGQLKVLKEATNAMGDIETALDAIIAIQKELLPKSIITFYIANNYAGGVTQTHTAVEGMTWFDWSNSEYNTIGIYCTNERGNVYAPDGIGCVFSNVGSYDAEHGDGVIVAEKTYQLC